MFKVEFHCHTHYSQDCLTSLPALLHSCRQKGFQRVVVTDHNTIQGALHARQIEPELVIVGEEVMTQSGELLAAFVQEEIPPNLIAIEVIDRLRSQGAFIWAAHPFDYHRKGHWKTAELLEIYPLIDTIETFNARCVRASFNHKAQEFAHQHNLPVMVGSDAHTAWEVGRASMQLASFNDAASLKVALHQATSQTCLSPSWVHLISTYAKWYHRWRSNH